MNMAANEHPMGMSEERPRYCIALSCYVGKCPLEGCKECEQHGE